MLSREEFQQKLAGLVKELNTKTAGMSEDEIRGYFKEAGLSEEQMQMVLAYADQVQNEESSLTEEDEGYLTRYADILASLPSFSDAQLEEVLQRHKKAMGFEDASEMKCLREQLISAFLPLVPDIATEMQKPDILIEDLIQEGNLGVAMGVPELQTVVAANAREEIRMAIREAIEQFLTDQETLDSKNRLMVAQVERLNESIDRLEEKLGRKIMVDELAEDMGISELEVLDILKLTGELPEELEKYEQDLTQN